MPDQDDPRTSVDQLSSALDAVEAVLDRLDAGADPDAVALALKQPVHALDAAAKEALG
ncbi:MAG: hypothetical protein K2P58_12360 [Hyphomonadaceae bacterium]|nr:hypothetical protein [Hyphomonadaceae bacterium]